MNTAIGTFLWFEHELGRVDLRVVAELIRLSNNEEVPGTERVAGTLTLRPGKSIGRGEVLRAGLPVFRGSLLCCGAPVNGAAELVSLGKFEIPARDGPYLLKAWGGDSELAAEMCPPHHVHSDTLLWWFKDSTTRYVHKQRLWREIAFFKGTMGNRSGPALVMTEQDPVDEHGSEVNTYKRTVAVVELRAPGGQVVRTEQDFGYGYPSHQAQYMYEEGNYSCDCNRSVFMGIEPGMSCGETIEMVSFKVEERD